MYGAPCNFDGDAARLATEHRFCFALVLRQVNVRLGTFPTQATCAKPVCPHGVLESGPEAKQGH